MAWAVVFGEEVDPGTLFHEVLDYEEAVEEFVEGLVVEEVFNWLLEFLKLVFDALVVGEAQQEAPGQACVAGVRV